MNEQPPDRDQADDVDEIYRRASAVDNSRPADAVRKAVLAHAERLAAERAQTARQRKTPTRWWWPAVFGSLAAAALAGLMVLPRMLSPSGRLVEVTVSGHAREADVKAESSASQKPTVAPAEELRAQQAAPPSLQEKALADARAREPTASAAAAASSETEEVAVSSSRVASSQRAQRATVPPPPEVASSAARLAAAPPSTDSAAQGGAAAAPATPPRASAPGGSVTANSASLEEVVVTRPRDSAVLRSSGGTTSTETALRRAAEAGDLPKLQSLFDPDAPLDINSRDGRGRTALMLATLRGRIDAVGMLLDHGADPNVADSQGLTPLQAATAGHETAIIAALRRKGAR